MRILLVEDDELNRDMLRRRLAKRGLQVDTAADGAAGVELAIRLQPDVVLMDLGLPILNGWEAAARIRAHPHGAAIPIIALTGMAGQDDLQRGADCTFCAVIAKPVEFPALLSAISEAVADPNRS
jgi:two-component system, cell cycle response regulator DivK